MSHLKSSWTLDSALEFIRELHVQLSPHYEVALAGSVLKRGESSKDVDIIIFPHKSQRFDKEEIRILLKEAGLRQLANRQVVLEGWRELGSEDQKWVEIWQYKGHRVDVFMMS